MLDSYLTNRKRRPTHPGAILREDVLPAAGFTQDEVRPQLLRVSRRTISEILHERQAGYHRHRPPPGARFWHVAGDVAWSTAGR